MRYRVLLLTALLIGAPPAGAQSFSVNTYTPGEQANPAIAGTLDGFVVVWESLDQDGDYIGVFGQRFASDGAPDGSEFQVNQYVFGPQALPNVAGTFDGGFIVAWEGYGDGGDYADIFARRFGSDGAPAGDEFQVSDQTTAYSIEVAPSVTATFSCFVVAWDNRDDVRARRFDSGGAPIGGSFAVNDRTSGSQTGPSIALAGSGFAVVWSDGYYLGDGQDGDGSGIFGRRFDDDGTPLGTEFQINTSTVGDQYGATVTSTGYGGFIVAWQSYGHVGTESGIFARRYDRVGRPVGEELLFASSDTEDTAQPRIDAGAGYFAVAWTSTPRDGGQSRVMQRIAALNLTSVGEVEAVQPSDAAAQQQPAVMGFGGREFLVVWRDGDVDTADIRGRVVALPTATETATFSPSPTASPSAVPTDTLASATPTLLAAATPTHTGALPACPGDCDRDGAVSVDELVLAVNVALGSQPASRCPAADGDGDQQVTVAELIAAVNRALGGCG